MAHYTVRQCKTTMWVFKSATTYSSLTLSGSTYLYTSFVHTLECMNWVQHVTLLQHFRGLTLSCVMCSAHCAWNWQAVYYDKILAMITNAGSLAAYVVSCIKQTDNLSYHECPRMLANRRVQKNSIYLKRQIAADCSLHVEWGQTVHVDVTACKSSEVKQLPSMIDLTVDTASNKFG